MTKEAIENLLFAILPYAAAIVSMVVAIVKLVATVIQLKEQSKENIEAINEQIKIQQQQMAESIKENQQLQNTIKKLAAIINRVQPEELQVGDLNESKNTKV